MQKTLLEKVTVNIGVGSGGEALENARTLVQQLTNKTPTLTGARARNPSFGVRKGDEIGVKATLRGQAAKEFLKKALDALDNELPAKNFDALGNVSFGIKEDIDVPGVKYDPKIGIIGFVVCVTLCKPGGRVAKRRIASRRLTRKQRVTVQEAKNFLQQEFGVNVTEKGEDTARW